MRAAQTLGPRASELGCLPEASCWQLTLPTWARSPARPGGRSGVPLRLKSPPSAERTALVNARHPAPTSRSGKVSWTARHLLASQKGAQMVREVPKLRASGGRPGLDSTCPDPARRHAAPAGQQEAQSCPPPRAVPAFRGLSQPP